MRRENSRLVLALAALFLSICWLWIASYGVN